MSDNDPFDWRQMKPGPFLDREVALALGWRDVFMGRDHSAPNVMAMEGKAPGADEYTNIPDFSTDLNVWADQHFVLWYSGDEWYASFSYDSGHFNLDYEITTSYAAKASTPALAVSRALLGG